MSQQHLENMRVSQALIHEGDTSWYVVTANGFIVSEAYVNRIGAEEDLERRRREETNER